MKKLVMAFAIFVTINGFAMRTVSETVSIDYAFAFGGAHPSQGSTYNAQFRVSLTNISDVPQNVTIRLDCSNFRFWPASAGLIPTLAEGVWGTTVIPVVNEKAFFEQSTLVPAGSAKNLIFEVRVWATVPVPANLLRMYADGLFTFKVTEDSGALRATILQSAEVGGGQFDQNISVGYLRHMSPQLYQVNSSRPF